MQGDHEAADVPNPIKMATFKTAFQQGNRGFYTIDKMAESCSQEIRKKCT
jgi:hypothetical protein